MPPLNDRTVINSLLQNSDIFQQDLLYRPTDPNFGVAKNVKYYHAYGLTAATLDDYVSSLNINHYWKNLVLGSIEVAQARDSTGAVIYEVVYSRVIDDLVNAQGESVSKSVRLPYTVTNGSTWQWNSDYSGPGIELTNNNTTATGTSSSLPTVLGSTAISAGQKVMFSITQNIWAPVSNDTGIGIGNINTVLTDYAGSTAASGALYDAGEWWTNGGTTVSGLPSFQTNNAVIDVAVDRVNNFIWFRVDNGFWNNNVSANPATATGGIDISSFTEDVYPAYSPYYDPSTQIGSQATINSSALSIPAGFTLMGNNIQINTVYPNSLINMRDQVIDTVGQISNVLPLWMICQQANGQTLGFTPAWVIAYAKPGRGEQLSYYISQNFDGHLNTVDFEVDRYELDNLLTKNWNRQEQHWIPTPPTVTTFDYGSANFNIDPWINNFIEYYAISRISGNGTVATVSFFPTPSTVPFATGQVVNVSGVVPDVYNGNVTVISCTRFGFTFASSSTVKTGRTGIARTIPPTVDWINVESNIVQWTNDYNGQPTIFDGNSLQFISPVDMYSNTNEYDKYLVFPRRNILE
jgi:hypothetical protein